MVKRRRNTRRKRQRGGFWPFSSEPEDPNAPKSGFFNSIGSYFSSATDKANTGLGTAASSITNSVSSLSNSLNPFSSSSSTSYSSSPTSYSLPTSSTSSTTYSSSSSASPTVESNQTQLSSYGGRRRHRRRTMRGGKGGLGLTYYATDVSNSGLQVADPTYWIKGGSRRKTCKTCRKTCKRKR
jgi:hypothetical protein